MDQNSVGISIWIQNISELIRKSFHHYNDMILSDISIDQDFSRIFAHYSDILNKTLRNLHISGFVWSRTTNDENWTKKQTAIKQFIE